MGRKPAELSEKHWKALKMLEAGDMSKKDIAAAIGVTPEYFSALCNGDISKAGLVADLFKKEFTGIQSKREENIKVLVKENQENVQALMRRVVKELRAKKTLTYDEKKLLGLYNNSLNKSTPAVNIKNLSYSYTQGMTPEELIHEFTRLKSIAESSFERQKHVPAGAGAEVSSKESMDQNLQSDSGQAQES